MRKLIGAAAEAKEKLKIIFQSTYSPKLSVYKGGKGKKGREMSNRKIEYTYFPFPRSVSNTYIFALNSSNILSNAFLTSRLVFDFSGRTNTFELKASTNNKK